MGVIPPATGAPIALTFGAQLGGPAVGHGERRRRRFYFGGNPPPAASQAAVATAGGAAGGSAGGGAADGGGAKTPTSGAAAGGSTGGTSAGGNPPPSGGKGAAGGGKTLKKGVGPAQNTRSKKGPPAQQKNPRTLPAMSPEEDAIAVQLQQGVLLAQLAGDRAAGAAPSAEALEDDLIATKNAVHGIDHIDFQDVTPAHEGLVTEAVAARAGLMTVQKVLQVRKDALAAAGVMLPPTRPTPATPAAVSPGAGAAASGRSGGGEWQEFVPL